MAAHDEVQELQEHAEHAQHQPELAPVSLTMAILAVLVAVTSLLGHRAHTEEIILQGKITDAWGYYQAKNSQGDMREVFLDSLAALQARSPEAVEKARRKYEAGLEKTRKRQEELQNEARKLENEMKHEQRRANRFDLGEVLLEMALVITSITLLTRRRLWWHVGMVLAALGVVVTITAFAIH